MAPEMPDVVFGEVVASTWGNDIRDRSIQRYATYAELLALNPTPLPGDLAYIEDAGFLMVRAGTTWRTRLGGEGEWSFEVRDTAVSGPRQVTGTPIIRTTEAGTFAAPTYTFHGGSGSGMLLNGTSISLARDGVNVLTIGNFFASQPIYDAQAGTANVSVASNGRLTRITSALKYKTDINDVDLADVVLRPVEYKSIEHGTHHYGLIADEVADQLPDAGVYEEDQIEDYDTRAVIAVLVAKINRLEAQLNG